MKGLKEREGEKYGLGMSRPKRKAESCRKYVLWATTLVQNNSYHPRECAGRSRARESSGRMEGSVCARVSVCVRACVSVYVCALSSCTRRCSVCVVSVRTFMCAFPYRWHIQISSEHLQTGCEHDMVND